MHLKQKARQDARQGEQQVQPYKPHCTHGFGIADIEDESPPLSPKNLKVRHVIQKDFVNLQRRLALSPSRNER